MCFGILDPLFGVLVFFRIALNSIRIANHVIHNTYNIYIYIYIYSNDALINGLLLMVNGSWLTDCCAPPGIGAPARPPTILGP